MSLELKVIGLLHVGPNWFYGQHNQVVGAQQKQWRRKRRRTINLHRLGYAYKYMYGNGGTTILEKLGHDRSGVRLLINYLIFCFYV